MSIDLSGESLHRRGYRAPGEQAEAPLKETLAAAMLVRAGWPEVAAEGGSVVDPLCGSGTLPIEAAMMAADAAPGLLRPLERWGFARWRGHDAGSWETLVAEAGERREAALARLRGRSLPLAFGYDRDARALALAQADAQRAGIEGLVRFERRQLSDLTRPAQVAGDVPGLVITNPPYGRRLGPAADREPRDWEPRDWEPVDERGGAGHAAGPAAGRPSGRAAGGANDEATPADPALAALYELLGERLRSQFAGWRAAVLVADLELGKRLGLRAHRANRLMNGTIPVTLLRMRVDDRAAAPWGASDRADRAGRPAAAETGAGRLTGRRSRAVPLSGRRAVRQPPAQERPTLGPHTCAAPASPATASTTPTCPTSRWPSTSTSAGCTCRSTRRRPRSTSTRRRRASPRRCASSPRCSASTPATCSSRCAAASAAGDQYARQAASGIEHEVHEHDLRFLVNFSDYLDTGLFLPGREVRALLRGMATGRAVPQPVRLHGHRQRGGRQGRGGEHDHGRPHRRLPRLGRAQPRRSTSSSRRATRWSKPTRCSGWRRRTTSRSVVVYLDPPTFSNSKKMGRATFDVRRDHADLIRLVARRLLAPAGVLVFACNARRFEMDVTALSGDLELVDLSRATLAPDFARRARAHHVWRITARN